MKKSAAIYYYKSRSEYKNDSRFYAITPQVVDYINTQLYDGNTEYNYGEYGFSELELNQMSSAEKYNPTGYYIVSQVIPIPGSPIYDAIRPPPEITANAANRSVTDLYGDLPARTVRDFSCSECGLHFSSERQLKRHQRHCSANAEKMMIEEPPEEPEIVLEKKEEYGSIVQKHSQMGNLTGSQSNEKLSEEPPSKRLNKRRSGRTGRHYVDRNKQQLQSQASPEVIAQPSYPERISQGVKEEAETEIYESYSINTLDGLVILSKEDVRSDEVKTEFIV